MSRIYKSSIETEGDTKWGLFYLDAEDEPKQLNEDWKPVIFDTAEEAQAKLDSIEFECNRENKALPFELEEAKKYAESHRWKYASTYAKTAPHEYLVKRWLVAEDQLLYERFVTTIKTKSVVGYFYGHKNDYLILGDYYYWFMPGPDNMAVGLINRTTTDFLEFRSGAYYYKPRLEKHGRCI